MHDRQRMIQRREAVCPCLEALVFAGAGRDMLHQPHGPGIATGLTASHVTAQDPIEHERQERFGQERTMMTGRGTTKRNLFLIRTARHFSKLPAEVPRLDGIVASFEAFHEDESPQMTGRARDLVPKHAWRSSFFRPFPAGNGPLRPRRSAVSAARYRCALVTQAFTAEFDNAVF
jgi:hypothetical protein